MCSVVAEYLFEVEMELIVFLRSALFSSPVMSMIINHVEFFLWYFFPLVFLDSCGVCSTDMCFWYCK